MPPRRSCFRVGQVHGDGGGGDRFNATTAFLLPGPIADPDIPLLDCFNATTAFLLPCNESTPQPFRACFNATTAFLLLAYRHLPRSAPLGFNATTAFLLPGS